MIGSRLGKWIVDREIGRGGMGRVYLGHEENGDQLAALKVLSADLALEPGFVERFEREIAVLRELSHPNIVRFFEAGKQDNLHYYAMEYVDGEDLDDVVQKQGRLPWKEVLDAALQICPALKHAHDRGIIHRDLKPPNLLRTSDGVIKLLDFGIAKVFASRHLTHVGGVVGTAEYLSPEQASGKPATKRSDLYSLGVVLYTLLTGRAPFTGHSTAEILHKHLYGQFSRPIKLVPEIPHEFDELVCQLLEKDPANRPADGLVLQRQLDSLRRKLERKSQHTDAGSPTDATVAENRPDLVSESNPGPATLMSRMMRKELEEQNRPSAFSQFLNRPSVLLPLFILCVGTIVWRLWPRTINAEEFYQQGAALMASSDPADWDRAWAEYLEPIVRAQQEADHKEQIEAFHQQVEDQGALRRALVRMPLTGPTSEAQRFYQRGLRLCQDGDIEAARQTWKSVVEAFAGVESEERWVGLCKRALAELERRRPPDKVRLEAIQKTLQNAKAAEPSRRDAIVRSLRRLFQDDPEVLKLLDANEREP
jgi:serine/threonine-protein kinase